jgi:NAD(P)-dependent dehydrogenase (short-subunit alcohol dehydrogenase family)
MELELEGKAVLVTGGSDGLGRALCRRLVEEGALVALCGRDRERLEETTESLRAAGGDANGVRADVTEPEDAARFVEAALDRWGRIDGLVNNAGRSAGKALVDTTDADFDDDLSLKLHAAARLCRLTMERLAERGGSIVNVLAVGGKTPGAGSMPSSVSRAAGMALTKALSKEAGPHNVRVNAVLIGLIESGQWDRLAAASGTPVEQLYETMAKSSAIPLGRVGRAEEFADLVSFLLSPRAGYVSGAAINLDGGLCAVV